MEDTFYTSHSSGDLIRIPLIKPLELISPDAGESWFFKPSFGHIDSNNLEIENINKFGVKDSIVVVYSNRLYIKSQMTDAWIITDLKNKTEKVFITEKKYIAYLNSIDLNLTQLHECNQAFSKFKETGELP